MKKCSQFKILEDFFMMKANKKYHILFERKIQKNSKTDKTH